MTDYETKSMILDGISKQTGLTLRFASKKTNPWLRILLESEREGFWEYSKPFVIDCPLVSFIDMIGELLSHYLKFCEEKIDSENKLP